MKKEYTPHPVDLSDVQLPTKLTDLIEDIAENVHEVWALGRIQQGWKYGLQRNDNLKEHPCLVPYQDLPEKERDYDRNTAISILKLIVKQGFKIETKD